MGNSFFSRYSVQDVFKHVVDDKGEEVVLPNVQVLGFTNPSDLVPVINNGYYFRNTELTTALSFFSENNLRSGLWLSGPAGSGKTTLVEQICARLNWPLLSVTASGRFEFDLLVGQNSLKSTAPGQPPEMRFELGPLAQAMLNGYTLLINEADLADPSELAGLNDVLEGKPLYIPFDGGMTIKPHPLFKLICTGNSAGSGDDSGAYLGVTRQNLALMDRFYVMEVDYMASAVEERLLSMQFPLIPGECRKMMCSLAHQMRLSFKRGAVDSLSIPMTTRSLIRWARTLNGYRLSPISLGDKLSRSFMLSLGNRLTQVDRIAVNELATAVFGKDWIQK